MSIRSKLAWTFILLLIFGITAISSYSILFIRNYLLSEGELQIVNDTEWLAITIQNLRIDEDFETNLNEAARTSGYQIAVYDEDGQLFAEVPYFTERTAPGLIDGLTSSFEQAQNGVLLQNQAENDYLRAFFELNSDLNPASYLLVSIQKDQIYEPIKTIRWIIYTGMFISIALVILVSILFSRYISRPILQLESAARDIAEGNVERTLNLDRKDEFGQLADSLNRMAERFRADNEEMKKLYEKQSQFFADITHEIRNPLHTITGSLEMLEMDSLSEEKKEHYLKTAARQAERINRLFVDLKTLQHYDSDSYFIEKQSFDIQKVINQVISIYRPQADKKSIEINYDGKSGVVYADPDKIEQVLENLISNAVKYTNEGSIDVKVEEAENGYQIHVIDSGIGISEEHLSRLFDRFYRTDKARSRDKGGTGLGLSVVKSILSAHNSDIFVKSTPGSGSDFWFTLPSG
ncbi:HAMP domain-containing sensor histidine kinase [Rhodohalobacter sp.]|uniref:sensor histidine kinase n=1 Tax=Rhodohalobacter sp. TaxID=1974210 RepID=UPI002ACE32C4|nr:HAMP domain-containing sensor histidine kinase [Rhodohalobacter sp.]MDZ7758350.1 HAMP domain-containing sensor histidine kinase [Rhodohalobacter sp.]